MSGGGQKREFGKFLWRETAEVLKLVVKGSLLTVGTVVSMGYVIESMKQIQRPEQLPGQLIHIKSDGGINTIVHVQYMKMKPQSSLPNATHESLVKQRPTVILDGNVGETSFDWSKVQGKVSEFANVLAIDRPGTGYSTAGAKPRSDLQIARDYIQILRQLHISGPLILVGHGTGGCNMQRLAHELNTEGVPGSDAACEGLVLLDAHNVRDATRFGSLSPEIKTMLDAREKNAKLIYNLSHVGLIRLLHVVKRRGLQARYTKEALRHVDYFGPSPSNRRGIMEEMQSLSENHRIAHAKELNDKDFLSNSTPTAAANANANADTDLVLRSMPLLVLSHEKGSLFQSMLNPSLGIDEDMIEKMNALWRVGQVELAQQSEMGKHLTLPSCFPAVHQTNPDVLVAYLEAMVNDVINDFKTSKVNGIESLENEYCPTIPKRR